MNRIRKTLLPAVALMGLSLFSVNADAQCKGYAKSKCIPRLAPFIHNGQLNSSILLAGEKAEIQMTFYQGQEYRIMVCAQPVLGKVSFRLLDQNKQEVFNSKNHKNADYWDFSVGATQQFYVEVEVPPTASSHGIVENGCVAVIVGFRSK